MKNNGDKPDVKGMRAAALITDYLYTQGQFFIQEIQISIWRRRFFFFLNASK